MGVKLNVQARESTDPRLTTSDKDMLKTMATIAKDSHGQGYAGQAYLGRCCNITRDAANKRIKRLKEFGYIKNVYSFDGTLFTRKGVPVWQLVLDVYSPQAQKEIEEMADYDDIPLG